ncbi:cobalt ECF transporter T component CbiQ [Thiospirochaeta perfilievii]|uniref:Cobalt ECF transporter T component CbiQ n=1 Tax=Thiospirochaeta perfilievii TaxID=252967 RepID=A0A5C1Q9Y9_9SPIO|nr:cobalt ECF transporter T component CbiQ [Thiospirochaeta perfilievii]QEN03464.1 cobalt ECF transporter T component CbiQ [Thiospirochaeta perfilievii]
MNKFIRSIADLTQLEKYANRDSVVHRVYPEIKVVSVLLYTLFVTSIGKYNISLVIVVGIIPTTIFFISEINGKEFISKLFLPLIFSCSLGILNPVLDSSFLSGTISLFTIILKSLFTISMTLLLVSTTPLRDLVKAFNFLKIPKPLVFLFFLIYRYIFILLEECGKTIEAYSLRVNSEKGLHISSWGSLVGQIIIRSYIRSESIYQAMLIRGMDIDSE